MKQGYLVVFLVLLTASLGMTSLSFTEEMRNEISGNVSDLTTGEALPGANVLIKGTVRGTASDLEGNFTIHNVPPGEYTLVVTYIGYKTSEQTIKVEPGKRVQQDFALKYAGALKGEVVTITAQAEGQMEAINQQLSARTIKTVVSSARIQELPDETAAKALSRLPGLSLQDEDKIVVRGIEAKMNKVSVNNIELPSTDLNDRSTSLGLISANMLSGIEVIKALTPDLDANAVGGIVNLRLKEAPSGYHFDILAQGNYNRQDRTTDNYKIWTSGSNRFFNDRLGAFLQFNASRSNGGTDVALATYQRMGAGADPGYGKATYGMQNIRFTDSTDVVQKYGASLIMDYRLPNGKFVFHNMYSNTNFSGAAYTDDLTLNLLRREYIIDRDDHTDDLLVNSFQGEHTRGGITLDYSFTHSYSHRDVDLDYDMDWSSGMDAFPSITENDRIRMRPKNTYNLELFADDYLAAKANEGYIRYGEFDERQYAGILNLEIPVIITKNIQGTIKFGGKGKHMSREADYYARRARLSEPGSNRGAEEFLESIGQNPDIALRFENFYQEDYDKGEYFLDGKREMVYVHNDEDLDEYTRLSAEKGWFLDYADTWKDDYHGTENLYAGYIMTEMNIGQKNQSYHRCPV
jgi:TonB-dependent receptor